MGSQVQSESSNRPKTSKTLISKLILLFFIDVLIVRNWKKNLKIKGEKNEFSIGWKSFVFFTKNSQKTKIIFFWCSHVTFSTRSQGKKDYCQNFGRCQNIYRVPQKAFFQSYFKIHFFHISVAVFVSMLKRKSASKSVFFSRISKFTFFIFQLQFLCRCRSEKVFKDLKIFFYVRKWLFPRTQRVKKMTVKLFVDAKKFTECFKILKYIFFWRSQVTFSTCSHGKKDCC